MPVQQVKTLILLHAPCPVALPRDVDEDAATAAQPHTCQCGAARGCSGRGAGYCLREQQHYKKIQTLSISFPIKYSLLCMRAGEQKPQAVLTLCRSNNRVL